MSATATAPTSGYVGTSDDRLAPGTPPAPSRPLSSKERAAISETIWRRMCFESVTPEPTDFAAKRAWRVDGQVRASLNFLGVARTLDEHAAEQGFDPIRRFPVCPACAKDETANEQWTLVDEPPFQRSVCQAHGIEHKPYFRPVMQYWHTKAMESRPALCEKSRQIMLSWCLGVGAHLWLALTQPGSLIGFQSETLDKARKLLMKVETMYRTLPRELQRLGPMSDSQKARARKTEDVVEFKHVDAK